MTTRRVLVVDDDPHLGHMVSLVLDDGAYQVEHVGTGHEALEHQRQQPADLVILDIGLPDMSGFDVLRELRHASNVYVLMLTGRGEASDIVAGLDIGADDYLVKPFRSDELSARVRALLRRAPPADQSLTAAGGTLRIEPRTRTVQVRGEVVELTPTEYHLLLLMAQNAGQVFDHRTLLQQVWGEDKVNDTAYLKVYIWHLRRKLELNPRDPQIVLTEWGVGYRLAP